MFDGKTSKAPIDIEALLHWALTQPVYQPFRGVSDRALMMNYGFTAIPKGAGGSYAGGDALLRYPAQQDATTIIAAINALDGWSRAIIRVNAIAAIRPDCMIGVQPRRLPVRKRCGKKHRKVVVGHRWDPVSPATLVTIREIYTTWWRAVDRLRGHLADQLNDWQITGFLAPEQPWLTLAADTA
jgi:hypothetical protein